MREEEEPVLRAGATLWRHWGGQCHPRALPTHGPARPRRAYPGPDRAPPLPAPPPAPSTGTEHRAQDLGSRRMPSQLEHAMETLMFTFHKYAGDKEHLAKEDLRALMDKEFPGFLENQRDPHALERILRDVEQSVGSDPFLPIFYPFLPILTHFYPF
ncbi:protein S100-A10 isoform X2 [Passer domesticus]|uniref:protein S100-A10 isoform X2 n=1 Tax=Passer domesticus TaxID=48849 RepID=UPI0030FEE3B4